jgi:hypothetical protein
MYHLLAVVHCRYLNPVLIAPVGARTMNVGFGWMRGVPLPSRDVLTHRVKPPPPFRPARGAEAEAPLGQGMVPDLVFFL